MPTDREQAIKHVEEKLRINVGLVLMAFDTRCDILVYAVSQRERVLELERALRELRCWVGQGRSSAKAGAKCDTQTEAIAQADAALEGK